MDILTILGVLFLIFSIISNKNQKNSKKKSTQRYNTEQYDAPVNRQTPAYDNTAAYTAVHVDSTPKTSVSNSLNTSGTVNVNSAFSTIDASTNVMAQKPEPVAPDDKKTQVHSPIPLFSNPSECVKAVIYSEIMTPKFRR